MKFGPVPVTEATGAILAHTLKMAGKTVKKGTRLSEADCASLATAGIPDVIAARLEVGDVHEDAAAERIARAIAGEGVRVGEAFTGRANLFAEAAGLLIPDRSAVDDLNRIDPAITLATLEAFRRVEPGRMVATVKIIPFAAPEAAVERAETLARDNSTVRIAPFRLARVGMVATTLPSLKPSVLDKTRRIMEGRLEGTGARIIEERRVPHEEAELAAAIRGIAPDCDCLLVFGASAIVAEADVIPAAIAAAGGRVSRFGMPVDPGNLLLLAELDGKPVLGAPGCARSPRENGFDWILDRVLAGLSVSAADIEGLGVGGLLMEIVTRPQPRDRPVDVPRPPASVGAVVLAAGQSSRMGGDNKLTLPVGGVPMVRRAVAAAREAGVDPIVVVTGHEAAAVRLALEGETVTFVDNPDYRDGLSTSLRAGLAALADRCEAAFVVLGDMPFVDAELLARMVAALDPAAGRWIAVPRTEDGGWGNPVLIHRRFFELAMAAEGDQGARPVLLDNEDAIVFVPADAAAVRHDVDTPEAYRRTLAVVDEGEM